MVNLPHATTSELHCAWNRNVLKLKFPSVYCQLRTLITKVFSSVHLARSRVIDAHYTYPNISKNKFAESRMTLVASYLEDRKRGCGRLNFFLRSSTRCPKIWCRQKKAIHCFKALFFDRQHRSSCCKVMFVYCLPADGERTYLIDVVNGRCDPKTNFQGVHWLVGVDVCQRAHAAFLSCYRTSRKQHPKKKPRLTMRIVLRGRSDEQSNHYSCRTHHYCVKPTGWRGNGRWNKKVGQCNSASQHNYTFATHPNQRAIQSNTANILHIRYWLLAGVHVA